VTGDIIETALKLAPTRESLRSRNMHEPVKKSPAWMDAEHLSAVKRGDIEAAHKPISPALRSGPSAVSGATRQEQIPSIEIISKDEIPLILESKPRDRLHYLDNFRAIAITTIIFGHCYSGWHRDTYWEQALSNGEIFLSVKSLESQRAG
jgi:hypothetical protein